MDRLNNLDVKQVRIGLAALLVLAVAVFLAVKLIGGDDSDEPDTGEAVGLTEGELIDRAPSLPHVAYWVGSQPSTEQYEVTTTPDSRIYVRYLTDEAQPGDPDADFLTVGTYVVQDAAAALQRGAQGGTISRETGYSVLEGSGNNAYVVFDNQPDLQIEIYSPDPGRAIDLAKSGALEPI